MRDDRLLETSGREFERYVDMLFENRVGANAFEAALREQPAPLPCIMKLLEVADAAVQAREWFERHGPSWLQPLPLVHYDARESILCSGDMARHLVVYYSNSLQRRDFNYLEHPLFFDYARGVMSHPNCPDYLQGDPELLAEFPPKPLPGLEGIIWHPPPPTAAVPSRRAT